MNSTKSTVSTLWKQATENTVAYSCEVKISLWGRANLPPPFFINIIMTKKLKLVFVPGCFDNFEGTQEELDELIQDIQARVDDGSLFDDSSTLELDTLSEAEYLAFSEALNSITNLEDEINEKRVLH